MLKRDISFNDQFENTVVTETHYFNLNLTELMEIDLDGILKKLSNTEDTATVALEIKKVILAAVGERDGKYFIKEEYVRKNFERTGAYNALVIELSSNADAAANFIKGLLPAELAAQYEKTMAEEAAKAAGQPTSHTAALAAAQANPIGVINDPSETPPAA